MTQCLNSYFFISGQYELVSPTTATTTASSAAGHDLRRCSPCPQQSASPDGKKEKRKKDKTQKEGGEAGENETKNKTIVQTFVACPPPPPVDY